MEQQKDSIDVRFEAQRIAGWFRWLTGVIVAIAVALLIVHVTVREDLIQACERSGTRTDADASNWEIAAQVRRKAGDLEVSREYIANAVKIRSSIPMPTGWQGMPLTRGIRVDDRSDGCEDSYRTLFPFIR